MKNVITHSIKSFFNYRDTGNEFIIHILINKVKEFEDSGYALDQRPQKGDYVEIHIKDSASRSHQVEAISKLLGSLPSDHETRIAFTSYLQETLKDIKNCLSLIGA